MTRINKDDRKYKEKNKYLNPSNLLKIHMIRRILGTNFSV